MWHSNDVCHCAFFALKRWRRCVRLPPGHMGLPFVGESLWLLWYYKLARRPDGFVHARRRYYAGGRAGDVGVYRTHLFGSPTVLVCSPAANKFILKSSQDGTFGIRWTAPELVGLSCVVNVEGSQQAPRVHPRRHQLPRLAPSHRRGRPAASRGGTAVVGGQGHHLRRH